MEKKTLESAVGFLVGAGVGIGAYLIFFGRKANAAAPAPGMTVAAPMPPIASPARYADLASVASRLDQLKTLFRSDRMTPEQTITELDGLAAAANAFKDQPGAQDVLANISDFKAQIEDYVKFKASLATTPPAAMQGRFPLRQFTGAF